MDFKNKKGISLIVLIIIIVSIVVIGGIITGVVIINKNKKKEPISYREFIEEMEDKDFRVVNVEEQYAVYGYIKHSYVAVSEDQEYQIEFYETESEENAKDMFIINKSSFVESKSSSSIETSVSIGNNEKYTLTTGGRYKVVSRIDDTLIYVDADKEYKDEIKEILKDLGY